MGGCPNTIEKRRDMKEKPPVVLSIAGSDPSGGAGIQADIKTCTALGCYAMTAITAVTVQNTEGVRYYKALEPELVTDQIRCVVEDIRPDAVKTGMLGSIEIAREVFKVIREYELKNIVVDPVLISTSGHSLVGSKKEMAEVLKEELRTINPTVVTPNISETRALFGDPEILTAFPKYAHEMQELLDSYGVASILVKGGDEDGMFATDILSYQEKNSEGVMKPARYGFSNNKVRTRNNHGTGCTLSAGIACGLAKGLTLPQSIRFAKDFVTKALKSGADIEIGSRYGHGPMDFLVNTVKTDVEP